MTTPARTTGTRRKRVKRSPHGIPYRGVWTIMRRTPESLRRAHRIK